MDDRDAKAFNDILSPALLSYGRDCSAPVIRLWWNVFRPYPLNDVLRAFNEYMTDPLEGRYPPVPATILGHLPAASNCAWPGPEEAWNLCPKSEGETAWVCQEMIEAYAAAEWSLAEGDMIGARMAFLEHYRAAIRDKRGQPVWWISRGNADTQEQREAAVLALLEKHPERAKVGALEDQRHKMAQLSAPAEVAGTLLRLASDAGKAGRELTEVEVREQVEAKAKSGDALAEMKKALVLRTATG